MSELKAILATPHLKMKNACDGAIEVYPKSEADKVIAELEESHKMEVEQLLMEIVKLKDKLQNVSGILKETREWLIESQRLHKKCADLCYECTKEIKELIWRCRKGDKLEAKEDTK